MIFLNLDLGELDEEPEELYALAHAANVACGGHAGDEGSMVKAIAACLRHGTRLGAHPSYPDREGFGRRALSLSPLAVGEAVRTQCQRLHDHAEEAGARVEHVKAHGALYHAADADPVLADAVVEGALLALGPVTVIGPAGGVLERATRRRGLPFAREGFADRGRRLGPDGRWQLVPRGEPGALVDDPAQAAALARALVESGEVDTLCVHGDTPGAVAIARAVREVLS